MPRPSMLRRDFCRTFSLGGMAVVAGLDAPWAFAAGPGHSGPGHPSPMLRHPLRRAPEITPNGFELLASPGSADIGGGIQTPAWMINGSLPSPLIRVRHGDRFRATLVNDLPDHLILHWHGLTPPEHSDGHPRFAVGHGQRYDYDFTVQDRAGTYWYHSHAHYMVGKHTFRGIAGLLLVEDAEEAALGLPSGPREIPIILQDRELDTNGLPTYANVDTMEGYMGMEPFGNGIHRPYLDVDTALYRFRILNGASARIFRLERSDGRPLVVIGNDGGLLSRPVSAASVDVAPGERLDLLVDLSAARVGESVFLRSAPFSVPSAMTALGASTRQGTPLELLELRVVRQVDERATIPAVLSEVPRLDPAQATKERKFLLTSDRDRETRSIHMRHMINGLHFEMERIDQHVPFGATEVWSFVNDGHFAHVMHVHATHFQVLSRSGGRGRVMPWEEGLKDSVLLYPSETVRVAVRFDAHRGLFPLHCHMLEHEDIGMMLNILVE